MSSSLRKPLVSQRVRFLFGIFSKTGGLMGVGLYQIGFTQSACNWLLYLSCFGVLLRILNKDFSTREVFERSLNHPSTSNQTFAVVKYCIPYILSQSLRFVMQLGVQRRKTLTKGLL